MDSRPKKNRSLWRKPTFHVRHKHRPSRRRRMAMVAAMALLAAAVIVHYQTTDRRIRRHAMATLERMTGTTVRIRQAQWTLPGQLRLKGVQLTAPDTDTDGPDVIRIDDILMSYRPWRLLIAQMRLQQVTATGLHVHVIHDVFNNSTNLDSFMAGGNLNGNSDAAIRCRNVEILYEQINAPHDAPPLNVMGQAAWIPRNDRSGDSDFSVQCQGAGDVRSLGVQGNFGAKTGQLSAGFTAVLEDCDVKKIIKLLTKNNTPWPIEQLAGKLTGTLEWDISRQDALPALQGTVRLDDASGQVAFSCGNAGIEHLNAWVQLSPGRIVIDRCGGSVADICDFTLTGSARQASSGSRQPRVENVHIKTENLMIAPDAVERLSTPRNDGRNDTIALTVPQVFRDVVDEYAPSGAMDVELAYEHEGPNDPNWQLTILWNDVTATYAGFPYRLEHLTGSIMVNPQITDIGPLLYRQDDTSVVIKASGDRSE